MAVQSVGGDTEHVIKFAFRPHRGCTQGDPPDILNAYVLRQINPSSPKTAEKLSPREEKAGESALLPATRGGSQSTS
jgi:hypothetical protein